VKILNSKSSVRSRALGVKPASPTLKVERGVNDSLIVPASTRFSGMTNTLNYRLDPISIAARKFILFWDMMEVLNIHGYMRASTSIIGRTTLTAWWELIRNPDYTSEAKDYQAKKLKRFYNFENRDWENVRDYWTFAYKLKIAAMYLQFFGQCAFHIVRDEYDNPLGLDFLHGLVVPNVNEKGKFKSTAFFQFVTPNPEDKNEYKSVHDIIYITNPDFSGSILGASDIEALSSFNLPLDILLQDAANNYIVNRDKPEAIYVLPPDIDDDAFNQFADLMDAKYSGTGNIGKNPIVVAGELDIKELDGMPEDLPYNESRADTVREMLAVAGTPAAKLGVSLGDSTGTQLKEVRREFHESTMIPLFTLIEQAFREQVHIREFNIKGWDFKFGQPDFLTAVERATVHMRYRDMGGMNANEIRSEIQLPEREDSDGEAFVQTKVAKSENQQGSPPEGREDRPDAPAETGEPTIDDQDPPRGDQHDDEAKNFKSIKKELITWQAFLLSKLERYGTLEGVRKFETEAIPEIIDAPLRARLDLTMTREDVVSVFDEVFEELSNYEKQ